MLVPGGKLGLFQVDLRLLRGNFSHVRIAAMPSRTRLEQLFSSPIRRRYNADQSLRTARSQVAALPSNRRSERQDAVSCKRQ